MSFLDFLMTLFLVLMLVFAGCAIKGRFNEDIVQQERKRP